MTTPPGVPQKSSNELAAERTTLADQRTDLAMTRTIVALDRTLLAWIRTAVSMISFGFTIYKFFQELQRTEPTAGRLLTPRGVGLVMIGLGVGSLFVATLEHRWQLSAIRGEGGSGSRRSLVGVLAPIIVVLGSLGFVLVLLHQ